MVLCIIYIYNICCCVANGGIGLLADMLCSANWERNTFKLSAPLQSSPIIAFWRTAHNAVLKAMNSLFFVCRLKDRLWKNERVKDYYRQGFTAYMKRFSKSSIPIQCMVVYTMCMCSMWAILFVCVCMHCATLESDAVLLKPVCIYRLIFLFVLAYYSLLHLLLLEYVKGYKHTFSGKNTCACHIGNAFRQLTLV